MKYQVGQVVYTATDIRGWFDYSMKTAIPANTSGTIVSAEWHEGDNRYLVKFVKEFGEHFVTESNLKLG